MVAESANQFFEDKELTCVECRAAFTWSAGEQGFYAEKNFSAPKRCAPCRAEAKAERERGLERQQQGRYD